MPYEIMKSNIVILANGNFPSHPVPLKQLSGADKIICCDGAAGALVSAGMEPDFIVGDLDSLDYAIRERFKERIIHIPEQETNDLTKAFDYSAGLNPSKITILGATGKREDHTIGNISLLSDFAGKVEFPVEMTSDYGILYPIFTTSAFKVKKGSRISIFSLDCDMAMESTGLQYPLKGVVFDYWWKATLNIASSDSFTLSFPSGRVIVFISHQ